MSDSVWMVISFFIYMITLVLHEVGHCVFPWLAGFDLFNVVIIGKGSQLVSFRILGLHFRFNKILIPYGGFFTTRRFKDVESYRELMRGQTKAQIFLTHLGGNLMNMSIALISWILLGHMASIHINEFIRLLVRLVFDINVFVSVFNLIPFPVYNDIKEFSGNDVVQLFRRLRAHKNNANISL